MGQQGWRTDQQSGMFWLDAWVFRADRTMRERGPTCAFNAGCSSNEDSGSTAAVVASAVAAAAVRKLGALWSLLAETVQKPRWRLPLVGQLSPLRAGWLAAELNLCWGWIAEGGVLGGRLQYDVPMSGNTGGHCGMVLAGASSTPWACKAVGRCRVGTGSWLHAGVLQCKETANISGYAGSVASLTN